MLPALRSFAWLSSVAWLAAVPAIAQRPAPPSMSFSPQAFPIHAEPGAAGVDDLWAAGGGYKVGFAERARFIPYLGRTAQANVEFVWQTEAVRGVGGELVCVGSERRVEPWRCTYDRGPLLEVWDVRAEGLAQSFRLAVRPPFAGALELTGRLLANMRARPAAPAHAPIDLIDPAGRVVASYGAATAIDAAGRSWPLTTSADADGQRIRIQVPATVLEAAAWPLTIDPLLAPIAILGSGPQAVAAERAFGSLTHPNVVAYTRIASAADGDVFARVFTEDWTSSTQVFARVSAAAYSDHADIAFAGGTGRWAMVFHDDVGARVCAVHTRLAGDTTPGATFTVLPVPSGMEEGAPRIGGNQAGGSGWLPIVREQWTSGLTARRIVLSRFDVITLASQPTVTLASGQFTEARAPAISKDAGGQSWVLAWQQSSLVGNWRVLVRRLDANGVLAVGTLTTDRTAAAVHETTPFVDGRDGRYLLAYGEVDTTVLNWRPTGSQTLAVRTLRFDWPELQATATAAPSQSLVTSATPELELGGARYDSHTRSHWAVVFGSSVLHQRSSQLRLLGYHGLAVEQAWVYQATAVGHSLAESLMFDGLADQFRTLCHVVEATDATELRSFTYPAAAVNPYGIGCSTGYLTAAVLRRGGEFGTFTLAGVPAAEPGFAAFALASANESLAPLQMPGCWLLVDAGSLLATMAFVTDLAGTTFALPVPEWVPSIDLHVQCAHLAPGANAAGWLSTNALQLQVR